jgi:hypothetical protein
MLVVTVELWPFGNPARSRRLGRLGIANIADQAGVSDYVVVLQDDTGRNDAGLVRGHSRADGFWPLLARAALVHGPLDDALFPVAERITALMRPR